MSHVSRRFWTGTVQWCEPSAATCEGCLAIWQCKKAALVACRMGRGCPQWWQISNVEPFPAWEWFSSTSAVDISDDHRDQQYATGWLQSRAQQFEHLLQQKRLLKGSTWLGANMLQQTRRFCWPKMQHTALHKLLQHTATSRYLHAHSLSRRKNTGSTSVGACTATSMTLCISCAAKPSG